MIYAQKKIQCMKNVTENLPRDAAKVRRNEFKNSAVVKGRYQMDFN